MRAGFVGARLWQLGHDAVAAGDGFTAMRLARRRSFHLLMLNVTPCDSAPLVMELRKVDPDFKLVLMSGYQVPFCYLGGFVFLPKPFSLQQISAAVRDAMDA